MLDGRLHPGLGVHAAAAAVLIPTGPDPRAPGSPARGYFSVFAQRKPMPGARAVATWW